MQRLIFLIMVFAAAVVGLAATKPSWNNRVWRSEDGLADNRVIGVKQSSDGFLWVATARGIMRFDGVEFKALGGSANVFSEKKIATLVIDSLDRLWIARQSGEILCVDHGSVVMKIPPEETGRNFGYPSIVEEQEGLVWVCFPNGNLFRVRDGNVESVADEDLVRGKNKQVVKDGLGQIWVSQGGQGFGVIKDGRFSLLETLPVELLAGSHGGGAWICSSNELWRYTKAASLEKICNLPEELHNIRQSALHEDRRGNVWLGSTDAGLFRFDGNSFSRTPSSSSEIKSIDEDRDGTIWVGTVDGLNQLTPAVVKFLPSDNDATFKNVVSICEDKTGFLWFVWRNGGMSKSLSSDLWGSSPFGSWSMADRKVVPSAQCVVADPVNGVWFGTGGSGVSHWQDGGVTTNLGTQNGLAADYVNALHMTQDGALWIGSRNSALQQGFLQRWHLGRLQSYPLPLDNIMITALTSDSKSNCWCATYGGKLLRVGYNGEIADETGTLVARQFPILSLCATPDGSLWVVFEGQGLGRLKDGRFRHYTTDQGLHENFISRILFDGTSRLWMAGNRGIFSVCLNDFDEVDAGRFMRVQSVVYGKQEGLPSSRATGYYWPGAIRDTTGRLLFGMTGGIAVISPEALGQRQAPPPVVIDRVSVDGRTFAAFEPQEMFSESDQPMPIGLRQQGRGRLRLPPGSVHLELSYTALSYKMPESTLFRCRMLGLNDEWSDMGFHRTISYFNMPPGDYRFQVAARNSDGVWSTSGAECAFSVMPYFWQTLWFKAMGVAGVMTGLWLVTWVVLRSRNRRRLAVIERQQAVERERGRIARDMHDDLGAGLTQISMDVAMLRKPVVTMEIAHDIMKDIDHRARDLVKSLDELVWAVNPKNDTVRAMAAYFSDFAQSFLLPSEVTCRLNIAAGLPDAPVSAERRHGLYLAFKEALHNVLQHSGATEVALEIRVDGLTLVIVLVDNGRGFEDGPVSDGSDGLLNMRIRLSQMGGSCVVDSTPGRGTRVTFNLPLKGADR